MLLSFTVRNHKSIRDEYILDFVRPSLRTLQPKKGETWGSHVYPVAGIFGANATGKVVKKCVELRDSAKRDGKAYDQCLCLVDFDQHTTLAEAAGVARREGVAFLVSRLKFEVWLLWHVSDSCSAKTTKQLDELVARNKLLEKGKHLSPRFPIEKVGEARAQAADPALCTGRVGPDPSSAMPVLVRLLNGESRRPF